MKPNSYMSFILVILGIVMIIYLGFFNDTLSERVTGGSLNTQVNHEDVKSAPHVDYRAPNFSAEIFQTGDLFSLSSDTHSPVIINFWASWCEPCHIEAPDLVQAYTEYEDDIELLAINMTHTDQQQGIDDFVQKYGISFPVLLDPDGSISKDYEVLAVPTTFFVDRHGIIQHVTKGMLTGEQLQTQIESLLNE